MKLLNDEGKWSEYKEGKTTFVLYNQLERIYDSSVFYNPKMAINRNLCLLQLLALESTKPLIILEPLAGSGIRGKRILEELPEKIINKVILGDISEDSIKTIHHNLSSIDQNKYEIHNVDALYLISQFIKRGNSVDVIDLDPFGSPIEFIDLSVRVLRKTGGLLMLTATDHQVLCGKHSSTCKRQYNAIPSRNVHCHEIALRILLYNVMISAGRYGLSIQPLLAINHEHFMRVHVRIVKSKKDANEQFERIGFAHYCENCSNFETVKIDKEVTTTICPLCDKSLKKAGPMWLGQLGDKASLEKMIEHCDQLLEHEGKSIKRLLEKKLAENTYPPLFYHIHSIFRKLKKDTISTERIKDKIQEKGYESLQTSFEPTAIKTTVPFMELIDIIKELDEQ